MAKVHLILSPGIGDNKVEIDGHELCGMISSLRLGMSAGGTPTLNLEIFVGNCEVDFDGIVRLDSARIPDELAREFYKTLKARFRGMHEN